MKRLASRSIIIFMVMGSLIFAGGLVQAEETNDTQTENNALREQVQTLKERINRLQEKLRENHREQNTRVSARKKKIQEKVRRVHLARQLRKGDRGEDVKRLQEMLSSNSEIYPEGLVTGYFGSLTESAVARLQGRLGVPSVGNVGPKTLWRVNELLKEGAGNSGMVPPGLLTASGIQRAFFKNASSTETKTEDDEDEKKDDDDSDEFEGGPDIENLPISEALKERLREVFRNKKTGDDDEEDEADEKDKDDDTKEDAEDTEDADADNESTN